MMMMLMMIITHMPEKNRGDTESTSTNHLENFTVLVFLIEKKIIHIC